MNLQQRPTNCFPQSAAQGIGFILALALLLNPALPRADAADYTTMGLPEGAIARLGKGEIGSDDHAIAWSPDGKMLAVATSIGIWLYDTRTYEELALLTGHTGDVASVSFSPDGRTLASGSGDKTVRLWNVVTRRESQRPAPMSDHPYRWLSLLEPRIPIL